MEIRRDGVAPAEAFMQSHRGRDGGLDLAMGDGGTPHAVGGSSFT